MTDERTFDSETDSYPLPDAEEQPLEDEQDELSEEMLREEGDG